MLVEAFVLSFREGVTPLASQWGLSLMSVAMDRLLSPVGGNEALLTSDANSGQGLGWDVSRRIN